MIKIMCDLCGRDVQTDKHLKEARDYVYAITSYGTPLDLCVGCKENSASGLMSLRKRMEC